MINNNKVNYDDTIIVSSETTGAEKKAKLSTILASNIFTDAGTSTVFKVKKNTSSFLNITMIGDSNTNALDSFTLPLSARLDTLLGARNCYGYVNPADSINLDEYVYVTKSGWTQIDNTDAIQHYFSRGNAGATMSVEYGYENIKIVTNGNGSYRYRITTSGTPTSWVTINVSSLNIELANSILNNHILEIEVLSGTIDLYFLQGLVTTGTYMLNRIGANGKSITSYNQRIQSTLTNQLAHIPTDILFVNLGSNDLVLGVSGYIANLGAFLNKLKIALPNAEIILIIPLERDTYEIDSKTLRDFAVQYCLENNVRFINLYDTYISFDEANYLGMMNDDVHFKLAGGKVNGEVLFNYLKK